MSCGHDGCTCIDDQTTGSDAATTLEPGQDDKSPGGCCGGHAAHH